MLLMFKEAAGSDRYLKMSVRGTLEASSSHLPALHVCMPSSLNSIPLEAGSATASFFCTQTSCLSVAHNKRCRTLRVTACMHSLVHAGRNSCHSKGRGHTTALLSSVPQNTSQKILLTESVLFIPASHPHLYHRLCHKECCPSPGRCTESILDTNASLKGGSQKPRVFSYL